MAAPESLRQWGIVGLGGNAGLGGRAFAEGPPVKRRFGFCYFVIDCSGDPLVQGHGQGCTNYVLLMDLFYNPRGGADAQEG